jgi:hypothetical protein
MDELPAFLKVATNFWALCLLLLFLIAVFHLLFVRVFKFGKRAWKIVDYVWLSMAALGLLAAAREVRSSLAANRIELATARTRFVLQTLRSELVTNPTWLCMRFVRMDYSPSNLEIIQAQFDAVCQWLKTAAGTLPKDDNPPFKPLNFDDTHFPTSIHEVDLLDFRNRVRNLFSEYESRRSGVNRLREDTERTTGEQMNFTLSPILLCVALALRFAKVGRD